MAAPGFQLLTDLPNFLKAFPKELAKATAAGQQEAVIDWRDSTAFPGIAYRFTWGAAKDYGFHLRRGKYGQPTSLRVHYAKQGFPMPREAMPGSKRSRGRKAPNLDKPWYVGSGGTRAKMLQKKPKSTISGGTVITRYRAAGWGINLLGGPNHRGIASAHWVRVPQSYPMKVYKDAVNRAGAYTMMVTRAIGKWFYAYASRTYRQEFEDLTHDLPWIQRRAEQLVRSNLRDMVVDGKGRIRLRFRRGFARLNLDPAELVALQGAA